VPSQTISPISGAITTPCQYSHCQRDSRHRSDQRRAGIQREPDPDRIDRDRRQAPPDRQVAEDVISVAGTKVRATAVRDAEYDQTGVMGKNGSAARSGHNQARNAEDAAQANTVAARPPRAQWKICEPIAAVESTGALVEAQRKGATQIRQSDRGQTLRVGEKRSEQYSGDREQRLRSDAATGERSLAGVAIFRHPSRSLV